MFLKLNSSLVVGRPIRPFYYQISFVKYLKTKVCRRHPLFYWNGLDVTVLAVASLVATFVRNRGLLFESCQH